MADTSKILNTGELIRTSDKIYSLADEINGKFKDLQNYINDTIGTDVWNGERANAFLNSWNEFARCFEPVVQKIITISQKANQVAQAAQSYSDSR